MIRRIVAAALLLVPLVYATWLSDFDQPKWGLFALAGLAVAILSLTAEKSDAVMPRPFDGAFLLVIVLTALTLLRAATGGAVAESFVDVARLALPIAVAALTASALRSDESRRAAILAGSLAPALVLFVQVVLDAGLLASIPHRRGVFTATIGNTALTGEFAVASLGFLPSLARALGGDARARLAAASAALPALYLAYRSDSRAAMVGAALAAAVVAVAIGRSKSADGKTPTADRRTSLAVLAGVVAVLGAALFIDRKNDWPDAGSRLVTVTAAAHPTNAVRLGLWDGAWRLFRLTPLTGVGGGRFGDEYPRVRGAKEWALSGFATSAEHPHDEPLRFLAEYGAAGFLAAGLAAVVVLAGLWRGVRRGDDAAAGALASAAGLAVFALAWCPTRQPATMLPFAVLVGLGLGRDGSTSRAGRAARFLPALVAIAATACLGAMLFADLRFTATRDAFEVAKRRFLETAPEGDERGVRATVDLGVIGRDAAALCESRWLGSRRRHRLILPLADLAATRERLLEGIAPGADGVTDDDRKKLKPLFETLPGPDVLRRAIEAARRSAPAHHGLRVQALVLERLARRVPEAVGIVEEALRENRDTPVVRVELARLYFDNALPERALRTLEEETALYPSAPESAAAWELLCSLTAASGKLAQALERVEAWRQATGDSDAKWALAGEIVLHFGETPETIGLFASLPETPEERRERGAEAVGRLVGAEPAVRRAGALVHLGRHPFDTDALDAFVAATEEILRAAPRRFDMKKYRDQRQRAIGRSKALYAWEHRLTGDKRLFEISIRAGRRVRPELLDFDYLELIRALDQGNDAAALEALRQIKERGAKTWEFLDRLPLTRDFGERPEVKGFLGATK